MSYDDPFREVFKGSTWNEKLTICRSLLNRQAPGIDRIAVALYDQSSGKLRTFMASPLDESPLTNYEFPLQEAGSLANCVLSRNPRLVNDLTLFAGGSNEHTLRIKEGGYHSSFTLPIYGDNNLKGLVFFNSRQRAYFQRRSLERVNLTGHLIAQMMVNHQSLLRSMLAALHTTIGMVDYRDPETGNHLKRMSSFSRLIARDLVDKKLCQFDDEQIDQIYHYAPMHDVGKIGTPDNILLKPGPLDDAEWEIMKQHAPVGGKIVGHLIENFGFGHLPFIEYLRQTAELHHEKLDGSGYPHGLKDNQIPLVARIIAVSDIFDALTSERPYKSVWSNKDAAAELHKLVAQGKIDADCVASLIDNWDAMLDIQNRFKDE